MEIRITSALGGSYVMPLYKATKTFLFFINIDICSNAWEGQRQYMLPFQGSDADTLRQHYDDIQGKLHALLTYMKKISNPVDAIVIPILESKLTNELKRSWEHELLEKYILITSLQQ